MRRRGDGVQPASEPPLGYGSRTVGLVAAAARVHDWPVAIGAGALAAWMASLVVGGLRRRLSRR
jgi:hypothetical protein